MEKINFKPTTKVEKVNIVLFILAGLIISIGIGIFWLTYGILAFLGICIFAIIITALSIKVKSSYDYEINSENEIIINYKFINKFSSTIRIDQITSVSMNQSFLEKIAGVYTIRFGIFGKNNILGTNGKIGAHQQGFDSQELLTLNKNKADEVFNHLLTLTNSESKKIQQKEKPKVFAHNFLFFLFTLVFWFLVPFLIISFIKTKKTSYLITENSLVYQYNYFLGSYKNVVPLDKLTNSEIRKNVITYALFNIGHISTFTGGSNDPVFSSFEKYSDFSNKITTYMDGKIAEKPIMEERPGSSYFSTFFFWYSIFFGILFTLYYYFGSNSIEIQLVKTAIVITLSLLYIGGLLLRYILYKVTSYQIYTNKVVDISGIINITSKEIPLEKIKYVEVRQNLFFERLLKQGTIHIYTPGSSSVDNKLYALEKHKELFDSLVEYLEE